MTPHTAAKCARCVAGLCAHPQCRSRDFGLPAVTDVAGTSACADCALPLLDLVLHPARLVLGETLNTEIGDDDGDGARLIRGGLGTGASGS